MIYPSPLSLRIARRLTVTEHGRVYADSEEGGEFIGDFAWLIDAELVAIRDAVDDAVSTSVNAPTYPDGPCLERSVRAALKVVLKDLTQPST